MSDRTGTNVCVIGGGATGLGVARDLAMRGLDVRLIERGRLGGGTTGHTHGVLHSGARYADTDPAGARECIAENRTVRRLAPAAVEDTGGLFVQFEGDEDYLEAKREACRAVDIPADRLDADTLRERAPELRETATGGLAVPDGVVRPTRLVAALADDCRRRGVAIHDGTAVTDVHTDGDRVTGVVAAADGDGAIGSHPGDGAGRIPADHVVNATGAWAGQVAAMAGASLEMRPTKGAMVVIDRPVSAVINRCRPPADGDLVVPLGSQSVLGTTSAAVDDPDDYEREVAAVERLVAEADAMVPVSGADVESTYWGVRPIPAGAGRGRDASRGFRVVDHADADADADTDGVAGLTSVVGGKLTTFRLMAEATADLVADRAGVDADCRTAGVALRAGDDVTRLDALAREFGIVAPADAPVVADAAG